MMTTEPWVRSSEERAAVTARLEALVGRRLVGCDYFAPSYWDGYEPFRSEKLDVVDSVVALHLAGGERAAFTWSMRGELEGLSLVMRPDESWLMSRGRLRFDATARWLNDSSDGLVITSVGAAWSGTEVADVTALWAVRLGFGERAAVIALGELSDDEATPRYQPDALIVIRDEEVAKHYQPPAAVTSAWGAG